MNEVIRQTALFVRDLLTYDEQLIRLGRKNYDIEDFSIAYIGVDTLGASVRMGGGERFDPVAEVMSYQQQFQTPVTLSFYGDGAWTRATEFSLRIKSQKSFELQTAQGIAVFLASGLTDVKVLTGQQYGERQELTLNVQFGISVNIDTLRIDTEQINLTTEIGTETYP